MEDSTEMKANWRYPILFLMFVLFCCGANGSDFSCLFSGPNNCPPAIITYDIQNTVVGNAPSRIQDLFGVDSDFHSVQRVLTNEDGEVRNEAVSLLISSGVNLIRNSGAPNEIDWRKCVGAVKNRPVQKLLTWSGPIKCHFGYAEYESFLNKIGAKTSWNVANLVGYEFGEQPLSTMVKGAEGHAGFIKNIAQSRIRYWELGNELSDGPKKWSKEKYIERAIAIGNAIKLADSEARLIIPLLIFKTDLAPDYLEHDGNIAKSLIPLDPDFSVHTYYENYPEGLHTFTWIARIKMIEERLKKSGVPNPRIWVSEHARWPKGNPSHKNWSDTWSETNDYDAVLHVGSYLFALSQVDSVSGAMWHALRGGPWNYIFATKTNNLSLSPVAQLFAFLNSDRGNLDALSTKTMNNSEDVVFTVLKNRVTNERYIWGVNKSKKSANVSFRFEGGLASEYMVQGDSIRGMDTARESVLSKNKITSKVNTNNLLSIIVEPKSLVSLKLTPKGK